MYCMGLDHLTHSKMTVMRGKLTLPNGYCMYIPPGLTFTKSTFCPLTYSLNYLLSYLLTHFLTSLRPYLLTYSPTYLITYFLSYVLT